MGEVISLDIETYADIPPRKILDNTDCTNVEHVCVITLDKNGEVAINISSCEVPLNMWMLEIAKKQLLDASME